MINQLVVLKVQVKKNEPFPVHITLVAVYFNILG